MVVWGECSDVELVGWCWRCDTDIECGVEVAVGDGGVRVSDCDASVGADAEACGAVDLDAQGAESCG